MRVCSGKVVDTQQVMLLLTMKVSLWPFMNVGTGIDLSIKELAQKIAATVGYEGMIHWDESKPDGTPKKQLDVSRLTGMGWQAKINLKDGLTSTVNEFKQAKHKRGMQSLKSNTKWIEIKFNC